MGWLLHRTWGGIVAGAFFVILLFQLSCLPDGVTGLIGARRWPEVFAGQRHEAGDLGQATHAAGGWLGQSIPAVEASQYGT